jgi:hypothetical protein
VEIRNSHHQVITKSPGSLRNRCHHHSNDMDNLLRDKVMMFKGWELVLARWTRKAQPGKMKAEGTGRIGEMLVAALQA